MKDIIETDECRAFYDGMRVDDTIMNRLDAVRSLLKNTTL